MNRKIKIKSKLILNNAEIPRSPRQEVWATHAQKRNRPGKRKKPVLFQQWPLDRKYLYLSYCWWKATCPFYAARWLTLPLVAGHICWQQPILKVPNGFLKPRLKTPKLDISNPKRTNEFQHLTWEKHLFSNSPGRHFLTTEFVRKSQNEIELKLKDILVSFLQKFLYSLHWPGKKTAK